MRFDYKITFLSAPETPFMKRTATFGVRDFINSDGSVDETSLMLKTPNPEALDLFVQATGIEGARLPQSYGRSAKMKVSKAGFLKGAAKNFPNNGMIVNVEFQDDNLDRHRVKYQVEESHPDE